MPVGTNPRNGNNCPRDAKTNGDEESSNSDDGSSMYDEEDGDRRKGDCLDDMQYLEQQFSDLKELLYQEKVQQLEQKIQSVNEGTATEYLQPLQELEEALKSRLDTAELQHQCRTRNIQNKYEEEVQSAHQDFGELCRVTVMRMRGEIEEKIRRLQEEKVMEELANESSSRKRRTKVNEFLLPEKRKKPVTVVGPCVVHMLRDMDIMEDLTDIRRGRASLEVQRREAQSKRQRGGFSAGWQ